MKRIVILISGRGSNMQAIVQRCAEQRWPARVAAVIANRPEAQGLAFAHEHGIATAVVDHKAHASREAFDAALAAAIDAHAPDLVVLAGFMRILGAAFVQRYQGRLLNIHPSLLPAFPGLHAQRQALLHGVKVTGATVHFVEAELDAGPIVRQAAVAVRDEDTEETLAARILAEEHRIYPEAIEAVLGGGWRVEGRRLVATPLEAGRRAEGRVNPG